MFACLNLRVLSAVIGVGILSVHSIRCTATPPIPWPDPAGMGVCATHTLQECIVLVPSGSTIEIGADEMSSPDSYTAVDESIDIAKSLTLAAAPGIDAVFTSGRVITVTSPSTGAVTVNLQRLTLTQGHVSVTHNSDTDSFYTLTQMVFNESDAGTGGCVVCFAGGGVGTPAFNLNNSRLELRHSPTAGAPIGINVYRYVGAWQINFTNNRVRSENRSLESVISILGGTGGAGISGSATVDGNQIFGNGFANGITYSAGSSSGNIVHITNNMVVGQRIGSGNFAIYLTLANSALQVINNTCAYNDSGLYITATSPGNSGLIANNLLAFNHGYGIELAAGVEPGIANNNNLVYGSATNVFTPGLNTITADPLLVNRWNPRLTGASPARDAGNNSDVLSDPPSYDADGELRIVNSTVDIGAFEWNRDYSIVHDSTGANTAGSLTHIDGLAALPSSEKMLFTPLYNPTLVASESAANLGLLFDTQWGINREDAGALSPGRKFAVMAPSNGRINFTHDTSIGNSTGDSTLLDNPELNANPSAMAFIAYHQNPAGGAGTVYDHIPALQYKMDGRWYIVNQDGAAMDPNLRFNVVVAPAGSPNAFFAVASRSAAELRLEYPLLDDNPCAAPFVTRDMTLAGIIDNVPLSLRYRHGGNGAPGHWSIMAEGSGSPTFAAGAAFNVMVQGAQAQACRDDRVFGDGYDG